MDPRYEAEDVEVRRDQGVTITYQDGYVVTFDLVTLRMGCPCATCRNLRDQDREPWPLPQSPVPLAIVDASFHGAWGLNITWNDGHATGIFPFDALRRWHERGEPIRTDSRSGGADQ